MSKPHLKFRLILAMLRRGWEQCQGLSCQVSAPHAALSHLSLSTPIFVGVSKRKRQKPGWELGESSLNLVQK